MACDSADGPVELIVACEGCVDRVDDESGVTAIRGVPGIAERPEPVSVELTRTRMPLAPLDIAAVPDRPGEWLLLGRRRVLHWHADSGKTLRSMRFRLPKSGVDSSFRNRPPHPRIHAAPGGGYAAVVIDYGRRGVVLDLRRGVVTMRLDRGAYHPETQPFPIAFTAVADELLLVHGSDWNRLDLSDPATGTLLTPRSTEWQRGQPRPEHYLDYFHGRLHCSPSGQWIADDGWVWHPVGVPHVWNVHRWRLRDIWESDDGSSIQWLCTRDYHWDSPMCWLDDERLVISGIGGDDLALIPGVRIFDPVTGQEVIQFAGPSGALHSDGRRLYSAGPAGTQVWDPTTGHRTGTVPGFTPTHHQPASHELASIDSDTLIRWHIPN
ncbi:MAG TPA: hypothetical protein VM677_03995 [Actinokineospora sp.]|nr:hypothetical protein [Actinokineospora sp.]